MHQPALVPVYLLFRVSTDVIMRCNMLRDGQELLEEDRRLCGQPLCGCVAHTAQGIGSIVRLARCAREASQRLLRQSRSRHVQRDGYMEEVQRIALHDECICIPAACSIGAGEYIPDARLDRPSAKGTLSADDGRLCVAICEQIFCRKDVRIGGVCILLTICGKQCEEIIIVCTTL